jgi:hypothetical protein
VALALMAAAGWWVLRVPAIESQALPAPPDIDIEPPLLRARRDAAIALALMPDDPWTFAESLAASAPGEASGKEDCGMAGAPRFDEPVHPAEQAAQITGASARFVTAQARLDAALRASADPLDRAVADLVNVGDMRTAAGRDEAVVQQAAITTDPRLYALGYALCHSMRAPAPSCVGVSVERWAQLDAGNGIPWIWMLGQAQARGDAEGTRNALSQLASATRFDIHFHAADGAVASRAPKDEEDLAAVIDFAMKALGVTATLPLPAFQPLLRLCRDHAGGDVSQAQQCRSISDVMFAHSDNLISQSISGALLLQSTGDASRRDIIRAERAVASASWSPATGFSECREMRDELQRLHRMGQVGEVEAMREQARRFIPP